MKEIDVARILDNIAKACARAHRDPGEVKIQGATKGVSVEVIRKAIALGITIIGENRVNEAKAKAAEGAYSGSTLCLIGHLQSNKASMAARIFDEVHSVDSERIASLLSKFRKYYCLGPLPVLLEVNVGRDPAKYGLPEEAALETAEKIMEMPALQLKGLFTVAPGYGDLQLARSAFRALRELRDDLVRHGIPEANMRELSMGMSADYEVAVEEGATIVRLGTVLFGPRQ